MDGLSDDTPGMWQRANDTPSPHVNSGRNAEKVKGSGHLPKLVCVGDSLGADVRSSCLLRRTTFSGWENAGTDVPLKDSVCDVGFGYCHSGIINARKYPPRHGVR